MIIIVIVIIVVVMYPYHRGYERAGFFQYEILWNIEEKKKKPTELIFRHFHKE